MAGIATTAWHRGAMLAEGGSVRPAPYPRLFPNNQMVHQARRGVQLGAATPNVQMVDGLREKQMVYEIRRIAPADGPDSNLEKLEREMGLEPTTLCLGSRCSTN